MPSSTKPLVLITGPSGFVGAHVWDELLREGYRVRGTIRSANKAEFLSNKYSSQKDDISFTVVPDIQLPGALDEAMADVDYVCHVASPYLTTVADPVKELIEPAVEGTKNVLNSALKAPKLKRLIVLSSIASVLDFKKNPRPGYTYTEADWNPVTDEESRMNGVVGYAASKTFAERAAWQFLETEKPAWDLVTLCPPMIYGPPLHNVDPKRGVAGLNTSLSRLLTGIKGQDPAFKPKVATPGLPVWVDVRDLAKAHAAALKLPQGVSERFVLCGGVNYFEDGLTGLRARGEKGLGEPGAKCDPKNHFAIDTTKAQSVLGIKYTPFQKTVEDVWESARALGLIE